MGQDTETYTELVINKRRRWILPVWGIFATLMYFLIAQGVPLSYESRLQEALTLFAVPLAEWHLPLSFYAIYLLTLEFVLVALASVTGLYLLLVSRGKRIATVAAFFMIIWVASWVLPYLDAGKLYPIPIAGLDVLGNAIYATLLLTFPSGRLQAPWVRKFIPLGFMLLFVVTPINSLAETTPSQGAFTQLILFFMTASAVFLQILRYRYHSTREERQQSKWAFIGFVFSYAIPITFLFVNHFIEPSIMAYPTLHFLYILIGKTFFIFIPFTLLPITMLFAITKSRLWKIDLLLNKAALASGMSIVLLVLFATGIAVFQAIGGNTLVAILSMLFIIAIAYNPLQNAIRDLLDRRIFGLRFNLNQLRRAEILRAITNPGQLSGTWLNSYEVLNVIARGGMGEVYQALANNQVFAIKTVLPELIQNPIACERFEREVRAGQLLNHPNIVQVYDSGTIDNTPYLVMGYIEGQSLKERINRQPMDVTDVMPIFRDVAQALHYTHAQGIIHRDIKTSNIVLDTTGKAILIDFGLVKFAEDTIDPTGVGAIGTIDYMAPEQIRSAGTVDHRADIYALAIVLYEMLVGKPPFGGDAGEKLFAHLTQPPPNLSQHSHIPEHISEAIERALMKDPDDRYSSIADFMDVVL